ncbi:MAG: Omp28-related outer membrane protein [Bacteroidales bacterium]|nr:Omp28-related outer membrane protein [Bacteroidales bacterium]
MKKFTFALMALLALTFSVKAQQYVSTEPANRNVILEEFTGRGCGYCTDGHRIANELMAANPGRLWAINIHAGGYAQTSYPNMITQDGNTIHGGFQISGYPTGVVNRTTAAGQSRSAWAGIANQQLNQASECNVAGMAIVNPQTRMATITVEVFYTGNSNVDHNYLTVAMLQDSILGSQADYGNYNPGQWLNGQYVHMHILRDVITESAWGESISPTTQGTLITRTYEYEIPEIIGSPNGVEVDIDNIFFLAWVSEQQQGQATRPILTGCHLDMVQGSDEPIYPMIRNVSQAGGATCTHTKTIDINVQNGGTETLTSMTLVAEVEGETYTLNWEGNLAQYAIEKMEIPVEVSFGTHPITVEITEANGQPFNTQVSGSVNCLEWQSIEIEGNEEELRLELMQDKFGNHITWEFTTPDGTVLASGGPYTMLAAGTGTQLHIENVTVPANECVKFTIHDQMGNGICCMYGHGYYIVKDSQGNVLFGDEDDGEFGEEASHLMSVMNPMPQVAVGETEVSNVDYNHADFAAHLTFEGYPDEVGFSCRKVTSSEPMIIVGFLNEFQNILGFTDDLEMSSIYMVKAYAIVNGITFYGPETTFQTWTENVDELESSLKLYPNPTANVLNVEGEGLSSVEIYNTMGQRVMTQQVNGNKALINTESLNSGVYFIRVYANDGSMLNRTFSVAR